LTHALIAERRHYWSSYHNSVSRIIQFTRRYNINEDYNFDETGFAIGLTATTKVVTRTEYYTLNTIIGDRFYNLESRVGDAMDVRLLQVGHCLHT
jgi:hypothetical protein